MPISGIRLSDWFHRKALGVTDQGRVPSAERAWQARCYCTSGRNNFAARALSDAMQTVVLIRLGVDRRAPMTVQDLTTGYTAIVPADPGVLAQLEHDVREGYFEAILNGDRFSFGNRVRWP